MNRHRRPAKIPLAVLAVLMIAITVGAFLFKVKDKPQMATGYEDFGGWVYTCSKPIEVEDQGATYGSGKPSLTPANETEAAKYCHSIGIE